MMKGQELRDRIDAEYQRSWRAWEKLERLASSDEDFEDTIERKYQEGYSDALAMVKHLLEEGESNA